MNWSKKRFRQIIRYILIIFLALVNGFVGLYVFFNVLDWKNPVFNPPDKTRYSEALLSYPPAQGPEIRFNGSEFTLNVMPLLSWNGTLVENGPVSMHAIGSISSQEIPYVRDVIIAYEGATSYYSNNTAMMTTPAFGITLFPNASYIPKDILPLSFDAGLTTNLTKGVLLTWQSEGDYYPMIVVNWSNYTIPPLIQSYPDFRIHVNSYGVVQQERYSRINNVLTIAIFVFAFVESILLIAKALPKRWLGEEEEFVEVRLISKDGVTESKSEGKNKTAKKGQTEIKQTEVKKKRLPPWLYKHIKKKPKQETNRTNQQ
jgi:hypothetical protein